jgi:predicted ATPase/serine/threonine protein kinase
MDLERFALVKEIFLAVFDRDPASRAAYLDGACRNDSVLRVQVEDLLANATRTEAEPKRDGGSNDGVGATTPVTLRAPMHLAEGTVLDEKYRIERELGAGGMGRVYRATQLALDRAVAVKVLADGASASPEAIRRFLREGVAVARLRHPNIVVVYDSGAEPGAGAYIAMELLDGRSLRAEIRALGRLRLEEALEVMAQVCSAVQAAHDSGVVHRDLKPDNIVVARAPALAAKVLDFGIAKLVDSVASPAASLTAEGALIGTPLYMSPEQCRGEEVDARSDVYSLGCVLYEMLTGQAPFSGRSPVAVIAKHLAEHPRPPSELAQDLPQWVDSVVRDAMAKSQADRFQSVAALARALALGIETGERAPSETATGPVSAPTAPSPARGTLNQDLYLPLPSEITSFVGREDHLREVVDRLSESRLVTLSGVGGIGKTRLALAAARSARERFDGVCFAELAGITDPLLVGSAVAKAARVRERADEPLLRSLGAAFSGRSVLLVLDNCEHLVEGCAWLVRSLLRECAGLRVLVTSREVLSLPGEAIVTVPTLSTPPPGEALDALETYDAIRLFVARVKLVRHDFVLTKANADSVAELSRKLEGIPLAIELAAARMRVLPVEQILAKMGDQLRFLTTSGRASNKRQRTLRAAIDWSYELLDVDEQALLRRLGVFAGGCRLEEAEAVCGGHDAGGLEKDATAEGSGAFDSPTPSSSFPRAPSAVLDGVTSLVDKSLLVRPDGVQGVPRFRMLEVVREYALERLRTSGEAEEIARRHAEVFLALAEKAEPEFSGARAGEWLSRLEEAHDNLRAALMWLLESEPGTCVRLAAALRNLWSYHGHYSEGRRWLEAALERGHDAPTHSRMNALRGAGNLAWQQGDPAARGYFEESLRIARETGDASQVAWSSYGIGKVATLGGDLQAAREHLTEALEIATTLDTRVLTAQSLNSLGEVERQAGDLAAARSCYRQALETHRRGGDVNGACVSLLNLGAVAWEVGDVADAASCYREALSVARDLGHKAFCGGSLEGLGAVAASRGDWARAGRLAGAAQTLLDSIGYELAPTDKAFRERYLDAIRAALGDEAFEAAHAAGRAMTLEQATALAEGDAASI